MVGTACAGLAGCGSGDSYDGGDGGGSTSSATKVSMTADAPRRRPLVKLRRSQFGPVLFSGSDRALYLFTRDGRRKSRCYGDCAAAWPPFYARGGKPRAGEGVDASLLGTVGRRDGRRQVTYRGQPLYFYIDDPEGQVLCNDVEEFGGTWFALDATGEPPA
jgi:predicted lipoprotein with Yx(FWY)xxD motif